MRVIGDVDSDQSDVLPTSYTLSLQPFYPGIIDFQYAYHVHLHAFSSLFVFLVFCLSPLPLCRSTMLHYVPVRHDEPRRPGSSRPPCDLGKDRPSQDG